MEKLLVQIGVPLASYRLYSTAFNYTASLWQHFHSNLWPFAETFSKLEFSQHTSIIQDRLNKL